MIVFLLGRVKLNMTLVVTATSTLYRSGSGFLLHFLSHFLHSNFKNFMYFSFMMQYITISSKGFLTIGTYVHFDRMTIDC